MVNQRLIIQNLILKTRKTDFETLQFGGSGYDEIHDIHVLSNGDFAISGYTTSTSIDGNANPNAASSFIAIIDKNLPVSGFIKQICFESANAGYRICGVHSGWIGYTPYSKFAVDASDNIYYVYADTNTNITNNAAIIKKRPASNLSSVTTGSTGIDMMWGGCKLVEREGTLWIGHSNYNSGEWQTSVTKVNSTTMEVISTTRISPGTEVGPDTFSDMVVTASGIFILTGQDRDCFVVKMDLNPTYSTISLNLTTTQSISKVSYRNFLAANSDYVYVLGYDRRNTEGDPDAILKIVALNQSNLAAKSDYVTYSRTPTGGKGQWHYGIYADDSYVYATGFTNDGSTGICDGAVIKISATSGSLVGRALLKYNDNSAVGQSSKEYRPTLGSLAQYASGKYVIAGFTTGNLTGFSNLGNTDFFIIKTDDNGKIINNG